MRAAVAGTWDYFFCSHCQNEKPIAEKVSIPIRSKHGSGKGRRAACIECAEKRRVYTPSGPARSGAIKGDYDLVADTEIPDGVMEAYFESIGAR